MRCKQSGFIMVAFCGLILIWTSGGLAGTQLEYQKRAHRYEGIRPKPVSGYDIELLSVLVNHREEVREMPEQFKVRFYLKESTNANLIVRELDPKHYYWMDKINPAQPWRAGHWNAFEWPTAEVIQGLEGIRMYDLGVVARLGKPVPARVEKVAPVILYFSKLPSEITGYLFTFKTGSDAHLAFKLYKEGDAEPLFQTLRKPRGGTPFTVRWDSSEEPEGSYKLVVTGYFSDTNDPIDQTVYFYHQPLVDQ